MIATDPRPEWAGSIANVLNGTKGVRTVVMMADEKNDGIYYECLLEALDSNGVCTLKKFSVFLDFRMMDRIGARYVLGEVHFALASDQWPTS